MSRTRHGVFLLSLLAIGLADAQDVRDRTRPDEAPGTTVTESQAVELTLTLVQTTTRTLQTWVRTAATIDDSRGMLTAYLCPPEAEWVQTGQRVRAFPPDSKSSIYQARVSRVVPQESCVTVEATLSGKTYEESALYVMEIVVQRGDFPSIPNEAIIEEGDRQVVYIQQQPGQYAPQEIHTGLKGELYTEILHGLAEGDQVVTLGSFFIDADYKLKATDQDAMGNAHLHH